MNAGAFFFQGQSLLLPAGAPDEGLEAPAELADQFSEKDAFVAHGAGAPESEAGARLAVSVPEGAALPPGWQAVSVRSVLSLGSGVKAGEMLRAFHLAQWRRESVFCGRCGHLNEDAPDQAARICPACARVEYPRLAPAVIALITNDAGEALLARARKFPAGFYALIAGFCEAGETLERTVEREIMEEVGIEVRDLRYGLSQPWPFPCSLMIGFRARLKSGEIRPDGAEIEDAAWFPRDRLPEIPGPGTISRALIDTWLSEAP
ncbi:MAG: NAD(+) diphosphatase [Treponema sp.]|nr:NAD(+) diphosphatase [Treponema sp.]